MNHPHPFQTSGHPINIPVSFNYSQLRENGHYIESNLPSNQKFVKPNAPSIITHNVPLYPPSKSISQIIYPTHSVPQLTSTVPFNHSIINEPKIHSTRPEILNPQNYPQKASSTRPNLMIRNLSDYRRTVSPLNVPPVQVMPGMKNLTKDKEMQKYDALKWQNKYEDLKKKYFELLTIVQGHSNIEDSWLLEEQNKLLREKVQLLQEKDKKYYNQVAQRIQRMIDFHKQTTTQECALLIDRYRLQSKYLQKI